MTFEQRLERSKESSHMDISGGRKIMDPRRQQCKVSAVSSVFEE